MVLAGDGSVDLSVGSILSAVVALQIARTRPLPDATVPNQLATFPARLPTLGNGNLQNLPGLGWLPNIAGRGIPVQFALVYVPVACIVRFGLVKTVAGRYVFGVGTHATAAALQPSTFGRPLLHVRSCGHAHGNHRSRSNGAQRECDARRGSHDESCSD